MVEDRITNLEARVEASTNLPAGTKAELKELIEALRAELKGVGKDRLEAAQVGDDSLDGLTALEATHPRLADLANRLAVALANMGI